MEYVVNMYTTISYICKIGFQSGINSAALLGDLDGCGDEAATTHDSNEPKEATAEEESIETSVFQGCSKHPRYVWRSKLGKHRGKMTN